MRKLLLTRGAPGCGKSSLIQALDLAPYALSMDALRLLRAAPVLTADGRWTIDKSHNAAVVAELRERAEERMARGELLALDNTMTDAGDVRAWLDLARRYRYAMCAPVVST